MSTGKVILITIVVSIITSAATFFGLRAASTGGLMSSDDGVLVPPLRNLRPDQARKMLEPKGLLLIVTERKEDPKVEQGLIASQMPLEGSKVKKGGEVRVVVSKGMSRVEVPAVAKQPLAAAMQAITAAGLKVGTATRQPDNAIPKDQVISTAPTAGQGVERGTTVNLVVSSGAEGVLVPKVVYRGLGFARKAFEAVGLKVGRTTYVSDEDRREGVILRQTPEAGTTAAKGTAVDLVINHDDY
jgi:serine/threonine-protein kinase